MQASMGFVLCSSFEYPQYNILVEQVFPPYQYEIIFLNWQQCQFNC